MLGTGHALYDSPSSCCRCNILENCDVENERMWNSLAEQSFELGISQRLGLKNVV